MVKNPPAKQELQVQSLGWEDLLEEEMTTHPCLGNPMKRRAWRAKIHGVAKESDMTSCLINNKKLNGIKISKS